MIRMAMIAKTPTLNSRSSRIPSRNDSHISARPSAAQATAIQIPLTWTGKSSVSSTFPATTKTGKK